MRNLSPEFQTHLAKETTTVCRLFILSLADERRFAFSDHDRPLDFNGLIAKPMEAAETEQRTGFDADSARSVLFLMSIYRATISWREF